VGDQPFTSDDHRCCMSKSRALIWWVNGLINRCTSLIITTSNIGAPDFRGCRPKVDQPIPLLFDDREYKAEALRAAERDARKEHPDLYYWAGFVLTGDPGGTGSANLVASAAK
jgi:hypothetical protein